MQAISLVDEVFPLGNISSSMLVPSFQNQEVLPYSESSFKEVQVSTFVFFKYTEMAIFIMTGNSGNYSSIFLKGLGWERLMEMIYLNRDSQLTVFMFKRKICQRLLVDSNAKDIVVIKKYE